MNDYQKTGQTTEKEKGVSDRTGLIPKPRKTLFCHLSIIHIF